MKTYELLTIFKPNLDAEDIDKNFKRISDVVEGFEGRVENVEKIGRKKLAYDIEKFRDGFFVCANVSIPADKVAEFKRQLRLNDSVLRTMFMEVSKKAELSGK